MDELRVLLSFLDSQAGIYFSYVSVLWAFVKINHYPTFDSLISTQISFPLARDRNWKEPEAFSALAEGWYQCDAGFVDSRSETPVGLNEKTVWQPESQTTNQFLLVIQHQVFGQMKMLSKQLILFVRDMMPHKPKE